jgi:RNA polymerase sigma factor (sigma-70 family)
MSDAERHERATTVSGVPVVARREPFDDFYRREFPRMAALACAVSGSRIAAEDIAQEALLEAGRRWNVVGDYDKPGAWLRRVTIQKASKRLRRVRVETAALLRIGSAVVIPPGSEDIEAVFDALRRLPARQRAAVALHYLDGYPVDDVARILQCASGTAKAHLHKARASLAIALGEELSDEPR